MASRKDQRTIDYAGPPPDPPPSGPELTNSYEYGTPPKAEEAGETKGTTSHEKGDEEESGDFPKAGPSHEGAGAGATRGSGVAVGGAVRGAGAVGAGGATRGAVGGVAAEELERPGSKASKASIDSVGTVVSVAASGAVPLLQEDEGGAFRRMESMSEWEANLEDRQLLIASMDTPAGSGEAAMAMGGSVLHWKRLLGLAVPGGWSEEYNPPTNPPGGEARPPVALKLLTSAWLIFIVITVFTSCGLQWAFCRHEYYHRMVVWPDASSNSTSRDYLCVPSYVWTYLVPRLLFIFGYVSIFACIFCLKMHDLEHAVARSYDVVTEEPQNYLTTTYYIEYCRRDPCVLACWCVIVHVVSLFSTLVGEDMVTHNLAKLKPPPSSALEWSLYIVTCFVRLMVDSMIGHCLVTGSLSIKYLELIVHKATWYLRTLVKLNSHLNASQYFFTRMTIVSQCVHGAQPVSSAAVLMAMLRICQIVSLLCIDQTNTPKRFSSLAQLPIAILFFVMVLHHIQRNISLTESWRHGVLEKDPMIVIPPPASVAAAAPPAENPVRLVHEFTLEEQKNRANTLWHQIIYRSPHVSGKVLGMKAGYWMYWAVLVIGALYAGAYYALLKHTPLI